MEIIQSQPLTNACQSCVSLTMLFYFDEFVLSVFINNDPMNWTLSGFQHCAALRNFRTIDHTDISIYVRIKSFDEIFYFETSSTGTGTITLQSKGSFFSKKVLTNCWQKNGLAIIFQ